MKNIVEDYQWPSSFIFARSNRKYHIKYQKKIDTKLIYEIESYFKKEYGFKAVLFPSARAGIASVLRYLKIDRSKEVFVNKWVSHCIFNTVGRYSNISTSFKSPNIALAVHKWGFEQILPSKKNLKIIEDSVDSIVLSTNDMFINNSEFEIISIPKVIGSISGGIVLTKNLKFYSKSKKEQMQNKNLGQYQSKRKFEQYNKKKTFDTWLYHESMNTYLDYNTLLDIKKNLKNFEINKKIILKRVLSFRNNFKNISFLSKRLGPVIPIKYKLIKNYNLMNKYFLLRNIHKSKKQIEKFEKVYLLPVHYKISNIKYNFYIDILKKCL
jgi:putative PLP-dependent aminotransferase (TIGR04422 family)